jgi:hypothetical protein
MDREALVAAIKAIPTIKSEKEIEISLPSYVHALMVTGGDGRKPLTPTATAIRSELDKVQRAAADLHIALKELSPQAAAVFRDIAALKRTARTIGIIAAAASTADDVSEFANLESPKPVFVRPAVLLAHDAAYIFALVSGGRPTLRCSDGKKYSPYLDFVTAIFAARGVKASPENSAKEALKLLSVMEKSRA